MRGVTSTVGQVTRWTSTKYGRLQDQRPDLYIRNRKVFKYNHACATTAMIEGAALTGDARWTESARKGIAFIEKDRDRAGGGWGYTVHGRRRRTGNTPLTAFMVLALHTAARVNAVEEAAGRTAPFTLDPEAWDGAAQFLDFVEEGLFYGYARRSEYSSRELEGKRSRGYPSRQSCWAMARFVRSARMQRTGANATAFREASEIFRDWFREHPPTWPAKAKDRTSAVDLVAWHFTALALQQARDHKWPKMLEPLLLANQETTVGAWRPVGPWGAAGGRIYSTAINTLTLLTRVRFPR